MEFLLQDRTIEPLTLGLVLAFLYDERRIFLNFYSFAGQSNIFSPWETDTHILYMEIQFNRTKIVATIGPASNNKVMLASLIKAGADVFRLNFSHGTHEVHQSVIHAIRELNEELGTNIAMLQDLQGPKIRVEEVENNGVTINQGDKLIITIDNVVGNAERVSTSYQSLVSDVEVGDPILIDDGNLELVVIEKRERELVAEVLYGGILKSRKGINLPKTNVTAPALTEKDYADLIFGLQNNVDWVALSFVRTAKEILEVKRIIAEHGKSTKVIAKIEKPQAVDNMESIIQATDGVMVARGDLGVEMPMEEVPIIQKKLVEMCNKYGKPVIVATQMLESMISNPRPTRAEANDVANAVADGADAVMLSAESAAGKYPVLAVEAMVRIAATAEANLDIYDKKFKPNRDAEDFESEAIMASAVKLATVAQAKAICTVTSSGRSAYLLAKHRPKASIFIFSRRREVLNRLNLVWGTKCYHYERSKNLDETIAELEEKLVAKGHLKSGDYYVVVSSIPLEERGRSNSLKLGKVK